VVLIYASKAGEPLGKPGFYVPLPEKSLVGFSRVFLEAGESMRGRRVFGAGEGGVNFIFSVQVFQKIIKFIPEKL